MGVAARKLPQAPRRGLGLLPASGRGRGAPRACTRGGPCASAIFSSPRSPAMFAERAAPRPSTPRGPASPGGGERMASRARWSGQGWASATSGQTASASARSPATQSEGRAAITAARPPAPTASARLPGAAATRGAAGKPARAEALPPSCHFFLPSRGGQGEGRGPRQPGVGLAAAPRNGPGVPRTHAPLRPTNSFSLARLLRTDREPEVTAA